MHPYRRMRCPAWPRKPARSGPGDSIRGRSTRAPRSRSISARIDSGPAIIDRSVGFYDQFELLELHRDDGIKTFQAREIATGRPVQAHLFVHPNAPESVALLKKLDLLPEEERRHIVDRGEHQGTPYVVTDRLVDQPGLREWLVAKTKKPALEAPPPGEKAPLDAAGAWKVVTPPPPPEPSSGSAPKTLDEQFASMFPTA